MSGIPKITPRLPLFPPYPGQRLRVDHEWINITLGWQKIIGLWIKQDIENEAQLLKTQPKEAKARLKLFTEANTNKDKYLSKEEYVTWYVYASIRPGDEIRQYDRTRVRELIKEALKKFDEMDVKSTGRLSMEEFVNAVNVDPFPLPSPPMWYEIDYSTQRPIAWNPPRQGANRFPGMNELLPHQPPEKGLLTRTRIRIRELDRSSINLLCEQFEQEAPLWIKQDIENEAQLLKIQPKEAKARLKLFTEANTNKDKYLSKEEYVTRYVYASDVIFRSGSKVNVGWRVERRVRELIKEALKKFNKMDVKSTGRLSMEQFVNAVNVDPFPSTKR